ncbi:MAG TPA: hypothetical protein VEW46_00695 [Pyrinomonadaceae bacterium]|nr:hypothetical protein [Pyrinomonadaceae bacterium]
MSVCGTLYTLLGQVSKLTVCFTNPEKANSAINYCCGVLLVILKDGAGDAPGAAAGATLGLGDAAGTGVASGDVDCRTERVPVTPGNDNINAMSMNAAAAPIVILASTLAVPRGPNAVLETLLEKRSPALDLPGCSKITTTRTIQARINNPYKM